MILKCNACGKYTLSEEHKCGGKAVSPHPAKYSPEDRYARYRRIAKQREGMI